MGWRAFRCVGIGSSVPEYAGLTLMVRCGVAVPGTIANHHAIRTMLSRSRTLRSALQLSVMLLALDARGAPVLLSAADPALSGAAAEPGRAAPTAVAMPNEGGATPVDASRIVTPRSLRANPSSASAAQTLRKQDPEERPDTTPLRARANAAPPPLPAAAKPAASAPLPGADDGLEINPDLNQAAKTALEWAHNAKQWVQPANMGVDDGAFKGPASSDERRSGTGDGSAMGSDRNAPLSPGRGSDYPPASDEAHFSNRSFNGDPNLIREGFKLIREIAGHPVTWVLIPVLVFGAAAWSVLQHRGQIARLGMGRRGARGQPPSSNLGRRRRKGTSDRISRVSRLVRPSDWM